MLTKIYQDHNNVCVSHEGNEVTGEGALWRAVITQALMDVANQSKRSDERMERARALVWFSLKNPDFILVCALADLDHHYVLKQAKEAIKRRCRWRKGGKKSIRHGVVPA